MAMSHKAKAVAQYIVPTALAYLVLGTFIIKGQFPAAAELVKRISGVAGLSVAAALAQDMIPKPLKEALIFFRIKDRLPGHRAFSPKFRDQARYNFDKITNASTLSALPPADQQRVFYSVYKRHASEPAVEHYSFRYLAWRDTAALILLLSIVTIPVLWFILRLASFVQACEIAGISFAAYMATAFAAKNMGTELVKQVLSVELQGSPHDISE